MKKNGFTLIEVMVVVLILGILAAVVATTIGDKPDVAAMKLTQAQLLALRGEVELFKADHHRYPESLRDLVERPACIEAKDWHQYRSEMPVDGWKRPYEYRVPGTRGRFDIVSRGADGKEGGEGVNADLWSHPPK
ncbi:MAG: type II secretion system major pseudopilin GspG [Planctomycetes bacterium]|nr:type II secretion system major pseudopilin GspG [Planctomycetota bacterium]